MTKIVASLLVVVTLAGVVASGTLALFNDTAAVQGIAVNAGNADIKLAGTLNNAPTPFQDSLNFLNVPFVGPVYPGFGVSPSLNPTTAVDLHIRNDSSVNIPLAATINLSGIPTGWGNELTYALQILIQDKNDLTQTTGWVSMLDLQESNIAFPGAPIAKSTGASDYRTYYLYTRVPYNYGDNDYDNYVGGPSGVVGNEIQNDQLTGGSFTITGTQVVL